jgi:hypothetical protein
MQKEVLVTFGGNTITATVRLNVTQLTEPPLNIKGAFYVIGGNLPKADESFALQLNPADPFHYRGMMTGGADFELLRLDIPRP